MRASATALLAALFLADPLAAPHNMEGSFLHMGDLLVKKGEVDTAREIYKLAQTAPTYSSWPHAPVLERRIEQAAERAKLFAEHASPEPEILFQSSIACVACHQEKAVSRQLSALSLRKDQERHRSVRLLLDKHVFLRWLAASEPGPAIQRTTSSSPGILPKLRRSRVATR